MKWVTREKARVDRIACPGSSAASSIRSDFLFVPSNQVRQVAEREARFRTIFGR